MFVVWNLILLIARDRSDSKILQFNYRVLTFLTKVLSIFNTDNSNNNINKFACSFTLVQVFKITLKL